MTDPDFILDRGDWRPIGQAPRNGRVLLVRDFVTGDYAAAWWWQPEHGRGFWVLNAGDWIEQLDFEPTEFRLPTAAAAQRVDALATPS